MRLAGATVGKPSADIWQIAVCSLAAVAGLVSAALFTHQVAYCAGSF